MYFICYSYIIYSQSIKLAKLQNSWWFQNPHLINGWKLCPQNPHTYRIYYWKAPWKISPYTPAICHPRWRYNQSKESSSPKPSIQVLLCFLMKMLAAKILRICMYGMQLPCQDSQMVTIEQRCWQMQKLIYY